MAYAVLAILPAFSASKTQTSALTVMMQTNKAKIYSCSTSSARLLVLKNFQLTFNASVNILASLVHLAGLQTRLVMLAISMRVINSVMDHQCSTLIRQLVSHSHLTSFLSPSHYYA